MTRDEVTRWIRHRQLQTWMRWTLVATWVGAFVLAAAMSSRDVCTVEDPSICGHPPAEASIALTLLTPFLLAFTPRAGYITALVAAICELGWDVGAARVAFPVAAGAILAGGAVIARSRSRQGVLAAAAEYASIEPAASRREDAGRTRRAAPRIIAAGFLGIAALACTAWYVHDATALAGREDRARRELTKIVRIDDEGRIFVSLDPSIGIPVKDSTRYAVDTSLYVLDAPDDGRLWMRPVAEPEDATPPLMFAVGQATVAVLLLAGYVQRSRAHQRLAHATRGIPLTVTIEAHGAAIMWATPAGPDMAMIWLVEQRGTRDSTEEPDATRQEAYQQRGYEPGAWEPGTSEPCAPPAAAEAPTSAALVGDLVIDGWAGLLVDEALLLPRRRVHAPRLHFTTQPAPTPAGPSLGRPGGPSLARCRFGMVWSIAPSPSAPAAAMRLAAPTHGASCA